MSAIPAATLTLLPRLTRASTAHAPGSKVRFLGCVYNYTHTTGILTLRHLPHQGTVEVDINVPLPELNMGELRNGTWVWVVGYVGDGAGDVGGGGGGGKVQAIRVWSAGEVEVHRVVETVEMREAVAREARTAVEAYKS